MGIEYGQGLRPDVRNLVMIGDDQVETQLPGQLCLGDGGNAAVDGNRHPHPVAGRQPQRLGGESITIFEPQGDVIFDLSAELPQHIDQQAGSGDAVDIVITMNGDFLPPLQGRGQASRRPGHPLHQKGIGQIGQARSEKRASRGQIGHPATGQNPGRQGIEAEALRQGEAESLRGPIAAIAPAPCRHRIHEGPAVATGVSLKGRILTRPM